MKNAPSRIFWFKKFLAARSLAADDQRTTILDASTTTRRNVHSDVFSHPSFKKVNEQQAIASKSSDRKAAVLTFMLSLLVAGGISLVTVLASGTQASSADNKVTELSNLVMKAAALGDYQHAEAMLKAAALVSDDSEVQEHISAMKSFVGISSAIRKIDRWNSSGKYFMSEKMVDELLKLKISDQELSIRQAMI